MKAKVTYLFKDGSVQIENRIMHKLYLVSDGRLSIDGKYYQVNDLKKITIEAEESTIDTIPPMAGDATIGII